MAAAVAAVEGAVAAAADPASLPFLGAGLSYREAWRWEVVRHRETLGAVECIPEEVGGPAKLADFVRLADAVPVLLHGIGLSLGSAGGLDPERVAHAARVAEALSPPWFSEHIAWTRASGVEIGHLTPLPFSREAVETVAANARALQSALGGLPLLLENIAYGYVLPGSTMGEADFVRAVVEEAGAFLLLDLENVHANSTNHRYDPFEHLERLPLERVVEVHLAGGVTMPDGEYADTHSRPVPEESWRFLEWLVPRAPALKAVIVERDDELPSFPELLAEVARARSILAAARP